MKRIYSFIFALLIISWPAFGQETGKRSYRAVKTDIAPVIDGKIDEEVWEQGAWDGSFTQFQPFEGKDPGQPTEFKVLFDNSFIYVAIRAYDSAPDSIVDRMTRRDNMDGDNVGIIFDSYHDLRTGFGFFVSSAGVKSDLIFSNDGQSEDPTWDPIWDAASSRFGGGWSAEMRIPLTQLRFKSNSGGLWGLEVTRQIYRYNEMSFWQPIPRNASGLIHHFGLLEGLGAIRPGKQIDLTPYAVGSYENYGKDPQNPFATGKDFRSNFGIDGKIGVTSNLTVDFTVLPDFGQVEADPSELNLTAYETFFQEKRPFFIEGRNITSFRVGIGDGDLGNDNLFYSRRIGRRPQLSPSVADGEYYLPPRTTRILGAAKLTGKTQDGLSIGIINAVTAEEKAEIDLEGERRFETVEPLTNYFVSRIQKDISKGNTIIGAVFTNTLRSFDETVISSLHKTASSAGIDFTQYFSNKNWMLTTTAALSNVQGPSEAIAATQRSSVHYFMRPDADYITYNPNRTSLTGHAGNIQFGKVGGNWNFVYFTIWKSPGFETNDLGYTRKADEFGQILWSAYTINKPFSIFNRVRFNGNLYAFWDFGGNFNSSGGNFSIYTLFRNQWSTYIGYNVNGRSASNTLLRGGPSIRLPAIHGINGNISSDTRKNIRFSASAGYRKGVDNYQENTYANLSVTWRPFNTLSVSASPGWSVNKSQLQYVTRNTFDGEDRFIFGTLNQKILNLSLRINYNITPNLSVQYWGQPFLAAIDFSDYKMITDPLNASYSHRFHVYGSDQLNYVSDQNRYYIDENLDSADDYSFKNPDANSDVFLSNLVLRWEFRPGSTIFLVWSQSRDYNEPVGEFAVWNNVTNLFSSKKPYDVFLVKFSYRFGLR
jgi:hypothetical protein